MALFVCNAPNFVNIALFMDIGVFFCANSLIVPRFFKSTPAVRASGANFLNDCAIGLANLTHRGML